MRNALALALLASTAALATLATGCDVPLGGCGGYTGGNDRVLARGQDAMILCDNGGFVVTMASSTVEGRYQLDEQNSNITYGTLTDTPTLAFTLTEGTDGTSTAPELGAGVWTEVTLDQVGLDHANVECTNLESATWWTEAQ
jgi:hypothetical protein